MDSCREAKRETMSFPRAPQSSPPHLSLASLEDFLLLFTNINFLVLVEKVHILKGGQFLNLRTGKGTSWEYSPPLPSQPEPNNSCRAQSRALGPLGRGLPPLSPDFTLGGCPESVLTSVVPPDLVTAAVSQITHYLPRVFSSRIPF